jgi:Tfp pilus assembly protein PilE
MKNIKDNKGITNMALITIVLVIVILMLVVAVIYLVKNPNTTYITQNSPTEQSQLSSTVTENEKETVKENVQVSNNITTNKVDNKELEASSTLKFANQTTASFTAYEYDKNLEKKVDIKINNGDIVFSSDNNKKVLSVNAKNMYLHIFMDVHNAYLYYINQDNELYSISLYNLTMNDFSKELSSVKVTDNKVTDFLGFGNSYSRDDNMKIDTTYDNIYYLLQNGNIESLVINEFKNNN